MTITKLQFEDKFRSWKLNESSFSSFNLLVGVSGVGKTRILQAIRTVRNAGTRGTKTVNGCLWQVEIKVDEVIYNWSAETSLVSKTPIIYVTDEDDDKEVSDVSRPYFVREQITRGLSDVIVDRTANAFSFNGVRLPKLKNTESAITLLREEESIAPLNKALRRIIFSQAPEAASSPMSFVAYNESEYNDIRKRYKTLDALREASDVNILIKAYILQKHYPKEFQHITDRYKDIFPTVCDITLGKLSEIDPFLYDNERFPFPFLTIAIKEEGINGWITRDRLSSGMLRTLIHLIELEMAPAGTVIVVDEFENSLGVNCLQPVTDLLLERSRDLQFIVTSHHPYIINQIPSKRWRIVTRKGSVITVLNENQVPALQTNSAQEKFIQLINSAEYEEGIQ